jgi:membrane-associated phospholipid phosphatase
MLGNWAKNILFLVVYMISGLVLIIIIDGLLSGSDLVPLNTAVENIIAPLRTPTLTNVMLFITHAGSPFILFAVAVFASIIMTLQKDLKGAIIFLVSIVVAIVSFVVLKDTFQIARPASDIFDVDGWSFPSGHATVATAFFFALAHALVGRLRHVVSQTLMILASVFGAVAVSFSRLYLGAHWSLDVMAGIALGLLSVSFTVLLSSVFLKEPSRLRISKKEF